MAPPAKGASDPEASSPRPVVKGIGKGLFEIGPLLHEDDFSVLDRWSVQVQSTGADTTGSLDLDLRLFHAADLDLDGVVDGEDLTAFALAFAVASPTVDMDGDGDVDGDDQQLFDAAYAAAQ